jgi:DNA repair protein RadC
VTVPNIGEDIRERIRRRIEARREALRASGRLSEPAGAVSQFGAGFGEGLLDLGAGVSRLARMAARLPGLSAIDRGVSRLAGLSEGESLHDVVTDVFEQDREALSRNVAAPESLCGAVARGGGYLASNLIPYGGAAKLLPKAVATLPLWQRAALSAAAVSPLTAAQATARETSASGFFGDLMTEHGIPGGATLKRAADAGVGPRIAADIGLDVVTGAAAEKVIPPVARALGRPVGALARRAREATDVSGGVMESGVRGLGDELEVDARDPFAAARDPRGPGEPRALLSAGRYEMPGQREVDPFVEARRIALESMAERTAANPPSVDEVLDRVRARDTRPSRAMIVRPGGAEPIEVPFEVLSETSEPLFPPPAALPAGRYEMPGAQTVDPFAEARRMALESMAERTAANPPASAEVVADVMRRERGELPDPDEPVRATDRGAYKGMTVDELFDALDTEYRRVEQESNKLQGVWARQNEYANVISGERFGDGMARQQIAHAQRRIDDIEAALAARGVGDTETAEALAVRRRRRQFDADAEARYREAEFDDIPFERGPRYGAAEAPDQARTTFGSEAQADRVAEDLVREVPPQFVRATVDGMPTSAERLTNMRAAGQRRAWVDVRGQRVGSLEEAHAVLKQFRTPKMERMHVLLLDDAGRVLSHTMETSGALNYVGFGDDFTHRIIQRAKRVGATRAVIGHNHPSGDPTPSGADAMFTNHVGYRLQQAGIRLDGQVVIDHTKASWIDAGGQRTEVVAATPEPGLWANDWTEATGAQIAGPDLAVRAVMNAEKPEAFSVIYLDSQHRLVAIEPHQMSSLWTMATWLPQRLSAHGALTAILGANSQTFHPVRAAAGNVRRIDPNTGNGNILDVIDADTGASAYQNGTLGDAGFQPDEFRTSRRVFEDSPALPDAGSQRADAAGRGSGARSLPEIGATAAGRVSEGNPGIGDPPAGALTPLDTPEIIAERARVRALPETASIRTPERDAMRQRWADEVYGQGGRKERQAFIVLGHMGSGKSSRLYEPLVTEHGAVPVDADRVKALIPESEGGRNARAVHRESSLIAYKRILPRAVANGDNVAIQTIGRDPESLRAIVRELAARGYAVHLRLVDVPGEEAARRALARWKAGDRFVDPDDILGIGNAPRDSYDALKGDREISSYVAYSNERPKDAPLVELERNATRAEEPGGRGLRGDGGSGRDAAAASDAPPDDVSGTTLHSTPVGPAARAALGSQGASSAIGAGVGALSADDDASDDDRITRAVLGAGVGLGAARYYRSRGASTPTTRYAPGGPVAAPGARPPRISRASAVDASEHVNLGKFALDPTGERRLTDMVQQLVARRRLDPKQVVTWEETRELARDLGLEDVLTSPDDARRLSGPESLAIRELVRENVTGIEDVTRRLADDTLPDAERETLSRVLAAAEHQTDALLHRFVKARSQTGRDLNNLKIIAQQSLDPVLWLTRAKRALGDAPLTEATRTAILEAINRGERGRVAQLVANLQQHSVGEKLAYLWKAGLLTSPKTHLSNALGNTSMAALEVAKDVPAFFADKLLAGVTGATTKAPVTVDALKASWRGAKRGAAEARRILRGEALPDALGRYDIRADVDLGNAFLNGYARTVFRLLSAGDRVFKGAALERSLVEQATVIARHERLDGADRMRRVQELVANPGDEMALRAIHDAEVATFQDRTRLGSALGGVKRQFGSPAEFLAPFTRTPSAIATRIVEYSPFGVAKGLWDAMDVWAQAKRGAPDLAKQRKAAEALGRGGTGLALIWLGYDLARDDKIAGAFPDDSNERARWQLENRLENSVLVDGKWRSIEKLGPFGQLMVLGANLFGFATDPEARSPLDVAGATAASIGRSVVDQSGFTGISEAGRAVDDPDGYARKYLSRQAASAVPTIVGQAAAAIDPIVREAPGPRESIAARVPGQSSGLPPALDVFGRPKQREPGLVANLLDPFYSRTDRRAADPLVAELARVGVGVNAVKARPGESPAAFRQRQTVHGPILERALQAVVASEEYQALGAEAAALVQREPRLRGQDPGALARELKRSMLEQTIRTVRSQLTRATTQAAGAR